MLGVSLERVLASARSILLPLGIAVPYLTSKRHGADVFQRVNLAILPTFYGKGDSSLAAAKEPTCFWPRDSSSLEERIGAVEANH